MSFDYTKVPIFITVRDRLKDLIELVYWLEWAGHERIILLDNASNYIPLQEWLDVSPHRVIHLEKNLGCRALWKADLVPDEYFVLTDPDVVPIDECPKDAVAFLYRLLQDYDVPKAGLGLYLDDVPGDLQCLGWEKSLTSATRLVEKHVYQSSIDTTFALYRPSMRATGVALRTSGPYRMRHMPWYHIDSPTSEEQFYLTHAIGGPEGSSWKSGRQ